MKTALSINLRTASGGAARPTSVGLAIAFVLLAACGGKKSTPAATTTEPKAGGDEHAAMMPEVAKFHDTLAPNYHAEKGPKRMADTCAAIPTMTTDADALAKATPPAGADAAMWAEHTKGLADAVVALDGTCKANDAAGFDTAFENVHKNFHAVMEAAGGHHGGEHEGMEHEHAM